MEPEESTPLIPPNNSLNRKLVDDDDVSSGSSTCSEVQYVKKRPQPISRSSWIIMCTDFTEMLVTLAVFFTSFIMAAFVWVMDFLRQADFRFSGLGCFGSFSQDICPSWNCRILPYHYPVHKAGRTRRVAGSDADAAYHRYRYYNKLADPSIDTLSIPDHIVPLTFFYPFAAIIKTTGKQNSVITIFAIWNTMMGTSLLSIPWAIQQAGFACGIIVMFVMGSICFYTAYRIVNLRNVADIPDTAIEFPDICRHVLGRWAEWIGAIFSLFPLIGGAIVYWVLMSNFLYFTGLYIYESLENGHNATDMDNSTYPDVFCPSVVPVNHSASSFSETFQSPKKELFYKLWDMDGTIPFYMALCLAPLVSLKSPTFFTKFNALGTLSVVYLIAFIIAKGSMWGIHFSTKDAFAVDYVKLFQPTFPVLSGICSLAFFIHNCVLSIMRNQRHPENNTRDLAIAYVLVAFTYLVIGVVFFITFPYSKTCIEDNLLNNFRSNDLFAVVTRVFLLFQVLTLYPLIIYILRVQILHFIFGSIYPSWKHVLVLNFIVLATCILFAIFLPKVGTIIRFAGAFAGLAYIFTLPCIAYMKAMKNKNELSISSIIFHGFLMLLGLCNFFAQFFLF